VPTVEVLREVSYLDDSHRGASSSCRLSRNESA
jgi:hypothetical protein